MELDKRIRHIDTIQTILKYDTNAIGCKGYFFDDFVDTKDLSEYCHYGKLADIIDDNRDLCFRGELESGFTKYFKCFIPESDLKPVEKKYRAFSLNKFLEQYKVGDLVEFRRDGYEEVEHAMFTGYVTNPDESGDKNSGEYQITIGAMRYSFAYLFEYYELFFEDKWQPFGVLVKENE